MLKVINADLQVIASESRIMLMLPLLYAALGVNNTFFRVFCIIMSVITTLNAIGYDEKSGFDRYILVSAVSRPAVVAARYALALASGLLILLLQWALSLTGMMGALPIPVSELTVLVSMLLLYTSLIMPVVFKYGVEKGRTMYIIILMLLTLLAALLLDSEIPVPRIVTGALVSRMILPASCLVTAASIAASTAIYRKKEL